VIDVATSKKDRVSTDSKPLRLLFVKETLAWPRSSGHDVHCYYMMRALTRMGHKVGFLTAAEPSPQAVEGLELALTRTFPRPGEMIEGPEPALSRLQERFRRFWGVDLNRLRAVGQAADDLEADGVVVVGLNVLPYLCGAPQRLGIWYAADEWFVHHMSQVRLLSPATWGEMRSAAIKGLYERAFRPLLQRVWVVTDSDRTAMRWVAGARNVDVIPNGVDGEHYVPVAAAQGERTCTFWGRLDFGPNIQALEWFCCRVWPLVRRQAPDARFTVYGFQPTAAVEKFASQDGVELIANLPDLRTEVARHQVVVLPFVSGCGIKNKLLEAASMGKAIVCSAVACGGLRSKVNMPFVVVRDPDQWAAALVGLWRDADRRRCLGKEARHWVLEHHSWQTAAQEAEAGVRQSLQEARR
jgi:glycosyltransferase involved in cell wall biosynthesis